MYVTVVSLKKKKIKNKHKETFLTSTSTKKIHINNFKNKQNEKTNNIFLIDMYNDFY